MSYYFEAVAKGWVTRGLCGFKTRSDIFWLGPLDDCLSDYDSIVAQVLAFAVVRDLIVQFLTATQTGSFVVSQEFDG